MHQPDPTAPASHHQWLQPSPALRPWVAYYLITTNDGALSARLPRVQVPPMTTAVIQVHLGTQPLRDNGQDDWHRSTRVAFAGPQTASRVEVNDGPPGRTLSVCFQPEGWYRFVRDEPAVLGNTVAAGSDVLAGRADELAPRLSGLNTGDLITGIEGWLRQRLQHCDTPGREAIWLRQRLAVESLAAIAGDMGISKRQLARRTRRVIGMKPKDYQRVARFHRLGQLSQALQRHEEPMSGAAIAAALDYFDQSHLARDIRDLTGLTPRQLMMQAPELGLYHQPPPVPLF